MQRQSFSQFVLFVASGFAVAAFGVAPASAGAWTPEQGRGEIIVTTFFEQASVAYNQAGRITPTSLYRSGQATAFVAYGVTDWLTAIIRPGVQSSSLGAPDNQNYTGLGDSEIAAQTRVWRDDSTVISVLAGLRAPTTGGATNGWLQGPDRPQYDFRLLLGHNLTLAGFEGFVDFSAGYRFVGWAAPDEGHFDSSFGLYAMPDLLVLVQSFNTMSGASSSPNTPQWAQAKAQFSLVYRLSDEWRVQGGGFVTLAGQNAYRENGLLLALWRKF
jgi:hypothetical protein